MNKAVCICSTPDKTLDFPIPADLTKSFMFPSSSLLSDSTCTKIEYDCPHTCPVLSRKLRTRGEIMSTRKGVYCTSYIAEKVENLTKIKQIKVWCVSNNSLYLHSYIVYFLFLFVCQKFTQKFISHLHIIQYKKMTIG